MLVKIVMHMNASGEIRNSEIKLCPVFHKFDMCTSVMLRDFPVREAARGKESCHECDRVRVFVAEGETGCGERVREESGGESDIHRENTMCDRHRDRARQ